MDDPAAEVVVREAAHHDTPRLRAWMRDFNLGEGIEVDEAAHAAALTRLIGDPTLGHAYVIELEGRAVGYAVITFNYDLEYPGIDAFLTELYVAPAERGRGVARRALAAIEGHVRDADVAALHLAVRPDNAAALDLYRAAGYTPWERLVLSKPLR